MSGASMELMITIRRTYISNGEKGSGIYCSLEPEERCGHRLAITKLPIVDSERGENYNLPKKNCVPRGSMVTSKMFYGFSSSSSISPLFSS